jgi:hypothetical protein
MNALYADFLADIRMRRRKEGSPRGAFMDGVLDQAEGMAKAQDVSVFKIMVMMNIVINWNSRA